MAKHAISINIEAFPSFRTGFLTFQDVTKLDFWVRLEAIKRE